MGTEIPLLVRPSRSGLVRPTFRESLSPRAANPSLRPAGADEAEADAPQAVAADPAVGDTKSHSAYGDAVHHSLTDHSPKDWHTAEEALRQSRLSRWQAQR